MRLLSACLAACALLPAAFSAQAQIEWLATDYDFGVMKEVAGPKTGQVRFVNKGKTATIINQVRPSCGCTGADYTRGEIAPGDTAVVSFTYNPKGRPGRFEKTVRVYTGADNEQKLITIRGTVVGAPETLESRYPVVCGPLRLSEKTLVGGDIRYGTARHIFLQGYNQSTDTIYPSWNHPAKSVSMGISDRAVAPGDGVTFSLYFNSRDEDAPGRISYPVVITADTTASSPETVEIEFVANVKPDSQALSASDLSVAPEVSASPSPLDLGVVKGKVADLHFWISNKGKSDLTVKRISGNGVTMKSYPVRLAAGKHGECKGKLDLTQFRPGPFAIEIEISTTDPVHPVSRLRVAGQKE